MAQGPVDPDHLLYIGDSTTDIGIKRIPRNQCNGMSQRFWLTREGELKALVPYRSTTAKTLTLFFVALKSKDTKHDYYD